MLFPSFRTGRGNNFTEGERELRDRATEKKGVERGVPDRAKHRKGRGQQEGGGKRARAYSSGWDSSHPPFLYLESPSVH